MWFLKPVLVLAKQVNQLSVRQVTNAPSEYDSIISAVKLEALESRQLDCSDLLNLFFHSLYRIDGDRTSIEHINLFELLTQKVLG